MWIARDSLPLKGRDIRLANPACFIQDNCTGASGSLVCDKVCFGGFHLVSRHRLTTGRQKYLTNKLRDL